MVFTRGKRKVITLILAAARYCSYILFIGMASGETAVSPLSEGLRRGGDADGEIVWNAMVAVKNLERARLVESKVAKKLYVQMGDVFDNWWVGFGGPHPLVDSQWPSAMEFVRFLTDVAAHLLWFIDTYVQDTESSTRRGYAEVLYEGREALFRMRSYVVRKYRFSQHDARRQVRYEDF